MTCNPSQILKHPCDDGIDREMRDRADDFRHDILLSEARDGVEMLLLSLLKNSWRIDAKPGKYSVNGETHTFRVHLKAPDLEQEIISYACNRASAFAGALAILFQKEIDNG